MKSVGDIFKELGFNKDASLDTQKAFLKHLISAANASTQTRTAEQQLITMSQLEIQTQKNSAQKVANEVAANRGQQLEFDLSEDKRVS